MTDVEVENDSEYPDKVEHWSSDDDVRLQTRQHRSSTHSCSSTDSDEFFDCYDYFPCDEVPKNANLLNSIETIV